ncbi:MAG: hypothetical protein OXQ84_18165 [bacterium]|nr:hypothetical protein [bacterium]
MFKFVSTCDDPDKLRKIIRNARQRGVDALAEAAFRRLISILPSERPGTIEHDFWRTIHSFEHVLSEERGRTTRLSRTRQKVQRVGVVQTLIDWALDTKQTDGFRMLLERDMPELTGEAIVLRHHSQFDTAVVAAARARLEASGVDVATVSAYH